MGGVDLCDQMTTLNKSKKQEVVPACLPKHGAFEHLQCLHFGGIQATTQWRRKQEKRPVLQGSPLYTAFSPLHTGEEINCFQQKEEKCRCARPYSLH